MGIVYAESNQLTRKGETFAVRHAAARELPAVPAIEPIVETPVVAEASTDFESEYLED